VLRGAFRQDLFFRLNGITLAIPPLRERTDEIPMLVRTFIQEACREMGREPLPAFTPEAMEHLLGYPWPGNIRELKNVIERALVLCDGVEIASVYLPLDKMKTLQSGFDTDELSSQDGGGDMRPRPEPASERTTLPALDRASLNRRFDVANFPPLDNPVKAAERQRILEALAAHAGNQTRAARFLGMPRRTFVTKLEQYGIPRPQKGVEGT
jgi:DNA-binding NtrC family response regulator